MHPATVRRLPVVFATLAGLLLSTISLVAPTPAAAAVTSIGDLTASDTSGGNVLVFDAGAMQVKVELCTDRTVRVQLSQTGATGYRPPNDLYYMVQKNSWPAVSKTITDAGSYLSVKTAALEVRVNKSPLRIGMYDLAGNLLSKDTDDTGMYVDGTAVGAKRVEGTANAGGIFGFGSGDHGRRSNLNRYSADFTEFTMSHGRLIAPFFMSTVGYGTFLNTLEKSTVFYKQGGGFQTQGYLDYYFMYGPDFKTILNEYAEITGRMELYGKWAHGFMLSKYGNDNATQAEFLQWLNRLRDDGYPADSYVFDYGWRGGKCNNQAWDTARFPDLPTMFAQADALGFHIGLHNNGCTPQAGGSNGVNIATAANQEIWTQSIMDAVITTGYGDWFWPDEFDVLGDNYQPTFAAKGPYEAWQAYTEASRPMFVTRGSFAGQHFATAWSGDVNNTSEELLNQVGFSLDAGLVGYWASSNDLGGFMSRPSNELYTRWTAEFGAWSGIMRTHGHDGREPWTYDTTAQTVLKQNLKIRYALYPYIYTSAWQGYAQGVPIMRAMILEDGSQTNSAAWTLNKQYYFGDWFLVAPAAATTGTTVDVWLPPNTIWYDYSDGLRYEGGATGQTITVAAPLEEIPVYVKAGAIVPMGPEVNYADEVPLNPLTLDIYPSGTSSYTLYEDDGESREYQTQDAYTTTTYTSTVSGANVSFQIGARVNHNAAKYTPPARSYNLKLNHVHAVTGVELDSTAVSAVSAIADYNAATGSAYYADAANDVLYVKLVDDGAAHSIAIASDGIVEPELGDTIQAPPPPDLNPGDRVEAETVDHSSDIVVTGSGATEWKGYSGAGYAKGFQSTSSYIEFTRNVKQSGFYDVVLNVNNGKKNSAQYDNTPRTANLKLDGNVVQYLEFEVTPTWGDSSKNGDWRLYTYRLWLDAGTHTFRVSSDTSSNPGNFNLDYLEFNLVDLTKDAFSQIEAEISEAQSASGAAITADGLHISADGAWAKYFDVDGASKGDITLRVKSTTGGTLTFYENGVGDRILATMELPSDGNWQEVTIDGRDTDAVKSNIFLGFDALTVGGALDVDVDWFTWAKALPQIVDGFTFEWEDGEGVTDGSSLRVDYIGKSGSWEGYTGTGYVAGWKSVGHYVQFTGKVMEAGDYALDIRFAAGEKSGAYDATPRLAALYIDGVKAADLVFEVVTGTGSWGVWRIFSTGRITLTAGPHTFKVVSEGAVNPGNMNLDNVTFRLLDPLASAVEISALQAMVAAVTALGDVSDVFTAESVSALADALDAGAAVLAQDPAEITAPEVADAISALNAALTGLTADPNSAAIQAAAEAAAAAATAAAEAQAAVELADALDQAAAEKEAALAAAAQDKADALAAAAAAAEADKAAALNAAAAAAQAAAEAAAAAAQAEKDAAVAAAESAAAADKAAALAQAAQDLADALAAAAQEKADALAAAAAAATEDKEAALAAAAQAAQEAADLAAAAAESAQANALAQAAAEKADALAQAAQEKADALAAAALLAEIDKSDALEAAANAYAAEKAEAAAKAAAEAQAATEAAAKAAAEAAEAAEAAAAKIADLEAQLAAEKANVKTVEVPGPTVIVEVPGDTPNTKDASKVTTSVKVSAQAFKKGTKPKVTVQITIPGGDARGRVALFVNGKKVKTMNVIRSKITVTLPKKYTKAIKVKAKYAPKLPKYGTTKTSATKKITTK